MEEPGPQPRESAPSARILTLSPAAAGIRLDLFLAAELDLSRSQARRLLERGAVSLDGRTLAPGDKGRPLAGEGRLRVEAFVAPANQRIPPPLEGEVPPSLLAEGTGWLALAKPAGMPVHPLRPSETGTLLGHVSALRPEVHGVGEGGLRSGVVHRLDIDTSGVVLVATNPVQWTRLRRAFHEHRVAKRYRVLVEGEVEWPGDRLELRLPLYVARHKPARVRVAGAEESVRGRSRVIEQTMKKLEALPGASLVEIEPRTGFLHQIRASLAHLGHPVLGDGRYGALEGRAGARRQMLHAATVRFEEVSATAPDPEDFRAVLEGLRAAAARD
jgi:RluA family pseudouridine synthase